MTTKGKTTHVLLEIVDLLCIVCNHRTLDDNALMLSSKYM